MSFKNLDDFFRFGWLTIKPALRKQLTIVVSETSPQERTSIFIASSIEIEGIGFALSTAFMMLLTIRVRYLHFNDLMTPWSIGCKQEVVFGGEIKCDRFKILNIGMGRAVINNQCYFTAFMQIFYLIHDF